MLLLRKEDFFFKNLHFEYPYKIDFVYVYIFNIMLYLFYKAYMYICCVVNISVYFIISGNPSLIMMNKRYYLIVLNYFQVARDN